MAGKSERLNAGSHRQSSAEREFVARLARRFATEDPRVHVGIGDGNGDGWDRPGVVHVPLVDEAIVRGHVRASTGAAHGRHTGSGDGQITGQFEVATATRMRCPAAKR